MASEKFDVSFLNEKGKPCHRVVKNSRNQIESFLEGLPTGAWLVAEHTGVYGDLLLYLASVRGVRVSYVSGYEIKHSSGLVKGKSDKSDAAMIREYGERYSDRLEPSEFPSESLYKLKELYATRRMLVEQRKQLITIRKGDERRPLRSDKAASVKDHIMAELDKAIEAVEDEMQAMIDGDPQLRKNAEIARSVPGIGPVTSCELIIKTDNFSRVSTARKCASLAGIAPFPNATGKSDKGNHVSRMGDKELKTLLYMCAQSSAICYEKMRLYKMKKLQIERKHFFVVMNNIANRLLRILYALIRSGKHFDPTYLPRDPRLKIAT